MVVFAMMLLACRGAVATDLFDGAAAAYDRGDYRSARVLWEQALTNGDWDAARSLGTLYRRGLGVEPDPAKAAAYYQEAVEHGVLAANLNLAEMKLTGQGTEKDVDGAKRLLSEAADKGAAFAKLRMEEIEEAESRDEQPPPLPERGIQPLQAATVPGDLGLSENTVPIVKAHIASYKTEKAASLGWLSFNLPGLEPSMEWVTIPRKGRIVRLYATGPAPIVDQICATLIAKGEPCKITVLPSRPAATPRD